MNIFLAFLNFFLSVHCIIFGLDLIAKGKEKRKKAFVYFGFSYFASSTLTAYFGFYLLECAFKSWGWF